MFFGNVEQKLTEKYIPPFYESKILEIAKS